LGFCDEALDENSSDAAAARLGTDVQALHLADLAGIEAAQRAAPDEPLTGARQNQAPLRSAVHLGQPLELGLETLKAQIDTEAGGIFPEQHPYGREVGRPHRLG